MRRSRLLAAGLAPLIGSLLLAACGVPSVEERTRVNAEGGYRYVLPPRWREVQGEVRSPENTLVSVQVVSLDYGDDAFVAGLPRSVLPQLDAWSHKLFAVVGQPTEKPATLGDEPALEVIYPVRTRAEDPEGHVAYWVARHRQNLFVVRVAFPPGAQAEDRSGIEELLGSWRFLETEGGAGATPAPFPTQGGGR